MPKLAPWRSRSPILPFLQIFVFNHLTLLAESTVKEIIEVVIKLLEDPQIEVRLIANKALSSIIKTFGTNIVPELFVRFKIVATPNTRRSRISRKKTSKDDDSNENLVKRHAAVLGMIALVESSPYEIPDWLPAIIDEVANYSSAPQPIQSTVQLAKREFHRTHEDDPFFKDKFTPEQLDNIRTSTAHSYYA